MLENDVRLIGRLARDPHLMSTQSGKSLAHFSIAVGYGDNVEFINCTAWNKVAENISAYTKKGSQIAASGHLTQREIHKDGKTDYQLEVVVDSIKLLDSKPKEQKQEAFATVDDLLNADQLPF